MRDKYELEDLILDFLRRQPCFLRISNSDVGRVHVDGQLDIGRLTDLLWEKLPFKSEIDR